MSGLRRKGLALLLAAVGAVAGVDAASAAAGIFYDRVLPLSGIERFDGALGAPAADRATWLQMAYEIRRAADAPDAFPDPEALRARGVEIARSGAIPLAILNVRYQRSAPSPAGTEGAPPRLESHRAFAATALLGRTWRGARVAFRLEPAVYVTNDARALRAIEADLADGRGYRPLRFGNDLEARYRSPGTKTARVRMTFDDGETLEASFAFDVEALVTPDPDDTLHVTAAEPWQGEYGTGRAYVYRAPGHAALEQPVVVVEGFDLDNTMDWDALYQSLNRENLLETLRAEGFDLVVLDFTDATVPIQENGRVLEALLDQVEAEAGAGTPVPLVGASMGGLVGRYALARLESTGAGHPVNTFISFDVPHAGANIPLGIQYWVRFFSGQSAEAAYLLGRLDRPAARQMLVYHYTDPATPAGTADPLRAALTADLTAVGDWPAGPRRVAIANGSGHAIGQGFAPGDQIIAYHYTFLVSILGDVWAVPDATSATIFDGHIRIIVPVSDQTVAVSGTKPYDNAPGGSRATMAQMDAAAVPYGDVIALHGSHCFIPTVSALAFDTPDLFHDLAADPDPLTHTPFDAIYFPAANEEHVAVTPQNAAWIRAEIEAAATAVGAGAAAARPSLGPAAPNPFAGGTRIAFALPSAGEARVTVYDVGGRRVRELASGSLAAGRHEAAWDGRDAVGRAVAPGLYLVRLDSVGGGATARLVRVR